MSNLFKVAAHRDQCDVSVNGMIPLTLHREYRLPEELSPRERTPFLYLRSHQADVRCLLMSAAEGNHSKSSHSTMSLHCSPPALRLSRRRAALRASQLGPRATEGPKELLMGGSDRDSRTPTAPRCHSSEYRILRSVFSQKRPRPTVYVSLPYTCFISNCLYVL